MSSRLNARSPEKEAWIDAVYVAVGANIRGARTSCGLSQETLARRVGLTRASICNIEAGRQRIQVHMLLLIAVGLGMDPESLLPAEWPGALPMAILQESPTLTGWCETTYVLQRRKYPSTVWSDYLRGDRAELSAVKLRDELLDSDLDCRLVRVTTEYVVEEPEAW